MTSTPPEIIKPLYDLGSNNEWYVQGTNPMSDKDAETLGNIVGNSTTVEELWIVTNISYQGMVAFVKELVHNTSLKKLVLYFPIDDQIAMIIGNFLKNNHTLKALGLCNNTISNTGGEVILNALQFNYTLEKLGIEGNNISEKLEKELNRLLKENEENPEVAKKRVEAAFAEAAAAEAAAAQMACSAGEVAGSAGEVSQCVVCYENPAVMAMVPCGHCCLCEEHQSLFGPNTTQDTCPMCRRNIECIIRIYQ